MTNASPAAAPPTAPAARRPRVWHLFVLLVVAQVLAIVIVIMGAGAIAASRGLINDHTPPAAVNAAVGRIMRSPEVVVVGLGASAVIGVVMALLVGWLSPRPFAQRLRLGRGRLSLAEVSVATIGFLALSLGFDALEQRLPGYDQSAIIVLRDLFRNASMTSLPYLVMLVAVAAPLSEELFYRGALQTRFAERYGRRVGLVIASLCFALAHMDVLQGLFAFAAGLYFGWLCDLAASCRASFVAHCANNLLASAGAVWLADADDFLAGGAAMTVSFAVAAACVTWLWRRTRERTELAVAPSFSPPPLANA